MRNKALRRRVWFKTLDHIERGIIYLAVRVVDKIKSVTLSIEIMRILMKIKKALRSEFVRRMEEFGLRRVKTLAVQAMKWGYMTASAWPSDLGFIRYLTVLDLNAPPKRHL